MPAYDGLVKTRPSQLHHHLKSTDLDISSSPSPEREGLAEGYAVRRSEVTDLEPISQLLEPFVQDKLLLRRNNAEMITLLNTGYVAQELATCQIIGFCAVEIYSKKLSEIQCLAVQKEHQRHGLGRYLVRCCVELAKERGVMEVMAISSSENFLLELGFDYSLPQQKRALFFQIRDRSEL